MTRTECPAISDYAIIGDCRTAALVSRQGSIDWLCLPDFNSSSVFAAILDPCAGGCFRISPRDLKHTERRYLPRTAVLETTFTTETGQLRLTDFVPITEAGVSALQPDREIVRIVEATRGSPSVQVRYQPRPDYARARPRLRRRGPGAWMCSDRCDAFLLLSDASLALDDPSSAVSGELRLSEGEKRYFSMSYAHANPIVYPGTADDIEARLQSTVRWWTRWSEKCCYEGAYEEPVLRSVLTLKVLSCALSGAVIAAPTASLPENIGGGRNWDYRYCWLRDASLTLNAFIELGYVAEGQAFVDWLINSTRLTSPELQVMYDIYGNTRLHEQQLQHLAGYRGSKPVRVGNGAAGQLQLDVYGQVTLAAYDLLRRGGQLDSTELRLLAGFGGVVLRRWQEPDEGIWEYRNGRRHNTYSKIMCWAVLDRLIRLHDDGVVDIARDLYAEGREAIRRSIEQYAYDDKLGGYVGDFARDTPDAALLLMARCRYVEPDDPRMRGTYDRLEQQIGRNGLIYRYPLRSDGIDEPEGAFGACSFWAAEYLARRGDLDRARDRFDHLLSLANDVGLFSEEIDPDTGEALGNFPQAFTHSGLINAALAIDRAERSKGGGSCA